ncbi:isopentenyl-diphosphate Delta-isomerase [Salinibacterium sp. dk2585]|uniref:isopentenyl-diphosphate Delta-isomerase n=1 Tax=unclassified Salinibacterium TaxID=2632331 RepID=UPI0011C2446A|nr:MULTISPECIES: isopentenyl-diphosphate Delta-isomerase [unclassified Salinibacterium]QEE60268.1 isopentenyl-diphosphate Delta-isomerase [Salinibacterium sp. dk2585]TXK55340.1 isopentenyl-diphosphate Delta-isomerase [Salinibacterium sp. dk5596]
MDASPELVVLLTDDGTRVGTAEKATVHTSETPLHLAFSCHLYNDAGEVLVTRRALGKATWPGVWTNSFCGHPGPEEGFEEAILRRAGRELGASVVDVEPVLPDFRYRAVDASGVVENEVCPVYRAKIVGGLDPAGDEIAEYAWVSPEALVASVRATPFAFSPWLVMQVEQWPGA